MVQIVETIKLTVEETEWNKLEHFDSLYNKRYRFWCLQKVTKKYKISETNIENLVYVSKMINIVIGKVHQIYTDVTSDDIARYVRQILAEDEYHRMKPTEVAKEVVAIITGSPTQKKRRPSSKAPASKNICDYISNT